MDCNECPSRKAFDLCDLYNARLIDYKGTYVINGHEFQCDWDWPEQQRIEKRSW